MSRIWNRAGCIACIAGLLLGLAACGSSKTVDNSYPDTLEPLVGQTVFNNKKYAESGGKSLWVDGATGEIQIADMQGQTLWSSYPTLGDGQIDFAAEERRNAVLAVSVVDTYNNENYLSSYTASVQAGGLTLQPVENGVIMIFDFPGESAGFTIPLQVTLTNARLTVQLLAEQIVTYGAFTIHTIDILPYFGAATKEDTGYFLVPDGSGALIRFDSANPEADTYSQPLYGTDAALTVGRQLETLQAARLPSFGVNKNGSGFVAAAVQGAAALRVTAAQPGKVSVFGNAAFQFVYTQRDSYTIADKDANAQTVYVNAPRSSRVNPKITYLFLDEKADYVEMAQTFRQYLLENGAERRANANIPLYLEFFGGAQEPASFLGIPYTRLRTATTLAQVQDILTDLHSKGVKNFSAMLYGFQKGGMYSAATDTWSFDRAFGGESAFDALSQYAAGIDVRVFPALESMSRYTGGVSKAARRISGEVAYFGQKNPVTGEQKTNSNWFYLAMPEVIRRLQRAVEQVHEDERGRLFLTDVGQILYGDYCADACVLREEAEKQITAVLSDVQDLAISGGNLYVASLATDVLHAPQKASGYQLETDIVPFYALVMHGLTNLGGQAINEAADPQRAFLECVSLGYALDFRLTAESSYVLKDTALNVLLSSRYADWADDIAVMQSRMTALDGLGTQYLTGYEQQGDLVITTYEDGTRVYVNFSKQTVQFSGVTVPAEDFCCVRGNRI